MTPGTLVLLHAPLDTAAAWGDLPELLRSRGHDVVAPTVAEGGGARYVARASLIIAATDPVAPLVLVGHGTAGPLLPAVALAQRAAHRKVGGYVFVDALLPRPRREHEHEHGHGHGPEGGAAPAVPADWPEAPCGYLRTHADRTAFAATGAAAGHEQAVREARLRGWPVVEQEPPVTAGQALGDLLAAL
ncbi:hypothetical protein [Actinomadura macrotermitis]|uniref:Alpha/beta hydrolase n=1 Tax=Actinomadura macrotermitis TaxID=2585200 RepID=A0A7K0BUR1_9ACTN|nr:hypothetical protein [Actinomadura macrotermitis]MQY04945.1 hypothetical protein [Actinomadura macrotermitis]